MMSKMKQKLFLLISIVAISISQPVHAGFSKWFKNEFIPAAKKFVEQGPATILHPLKIIKDPVSILERPSSVLIPNKSLIEAAGLGKPLDKVINTAEQAVGNGITLTGRVLKNVAAPTVDELAKFGKEALDAYEKVVVNTTGLGVSVFDEIYGDQPWSIDLGVATIKSHNSLGRNLQDAMTINELLLKKISIDALGISADVLEASGKVLEEVGFFIALAGKGFPPFVDNPQPNINQPDIIAAFPPSLLQNLISEASSGPIRYGAGGSPNNKYIQLGKMVVMPSEQTNTIIIEAKNATIGWDASDLIAFGGMFKVGIKINTMILQLVPVIDLNDGGGKLKFYGRIAFIDIKDTPPRIDQYIAHLLQNKILNASPIYEVDISKYTSVKVKSSFIRDYSSAEMDKGERVFKMKKASFSTHKKGFELRVKTQ